MTYRNKSTHRHTHKHTTLTHTHSCKWTSAFNLEVWICTKAIHRPNHNRTQVLTSSVHTHTHTPAEALAQGRKTLLCLYMPSWPSACRCVIDKPLFPPLPLECKNRKSKACVPPWVQIKKCPLPFCHMAKVCVCVCERARKRERMLLYFALHTFCTPPALAIQMYSFCLDNKAHLNWNWGGGVSRKHVTFLQAVVGHHLFRRPDTWKRKRERG